MRVLSGIAILVVAVSAATPASAQCPDGTPPPCAVRRPTSPARLVLVSDLRSAPADSSNARLASDALRLSLVQSRLVRTMTPQSVADALRRMERNPNDRLSVEVARELARREGVGVVVEGDISRGERGFTAVVRAITADSGSVIAVVPVSAANVVAIPDAMDRAARGLRARLGESSEMIRSSPRLAQVTTSSLQALEKYTAGARANDVERDYPKAVALLKEAVALDTTFAEAWRKLAAASVNARTASPKEINSYTARAFANRQHLTPIERARTEIAYYGQRDQARQLAAYEEWFRLENDSAILGYLAPIYLSRREYSEAETRAAAATRAGNNEIGVIQVLVNALLYQGKVRQADSVVHVAARRPGNPRLELQYKCSRDPPKGCDALEHTLDSLRTQGRPQERVVALERLSDLAAMRGKLRLWRELQGELREINTARGAVSLSPGPAAVYGANGLDVWIRREVTAVGPRLDSVDVTGFGPPGLAEMAKHYAWGNRPERARELLARSRAQATDSTGIQGYQARAAWAEAEIALAEKRFQDAIAKFRALDVMPYIEAAACNTCVFFNVARVYEAAGQRDSAIANYERAFSGPSTLSGINWTAAGDYERLCRLYGDAQKYDRAQPFCAKFIEYWENADAELQPRVTEARRILSKSKSARRFFVKGVDVGN